MVDIVVTDRAGPDSYAVADARTGRWSQGVGDISLDAVIAICDILATGPVRAVTVSGGEPTAHPHLLEILWYMLERGLSVQVRTVGVCDQALTDELADLTNYGTLRFLVELSGSSGGLGRHEEQRQFLKRLGQWCDLGLISLGPDSPPPSATELVRDAGPAGSLHVRGAPSMDPAGDRSLDLPHYGRVATRLVELAEEASRAGCRVVLEDGFPLCGFSDGQLGALARCGAHLRFGCHPRLRILPTLEAWCCGALGAECREPLGPAGAWREASTPLLATQPGARLLGCQVLEACADCRHRMRGVCSGSCSVGAGRPSSGPARGAGG